MNVRTNKNYRLNKKQKAPIRDKKAMTKSKNRRKKMKRKLNIKIKTTKIWRLMIKIKINNWQKYKY